MSRLLTILLILLIAPVAVYAQITSQADSLRKSINLSQMEPETVGSIAELAEILVKSSELTEAKAWMELGLEISEMIDYKPGIRNLSLIMSDLYMSRNMSDSVMVYADRAYALSETAEERASAKNMRANAFTLEGKNILAIDLYEQVAVILDSLGRDDNLNLIRFNIATAYSELGDNINALKIYYDAYEYAERRGKVEELAVAANNIGHLFTELENYEQAEFYLKQSESVSEEMGLVSNLVRVYLNLGNLYSVNEQFDTAEDYYNRSLEIRDRIQDEAGKIRVYYNMGLMELRRGDFDEARTQLQRSAVLSQETGHAQGIFYSSKGMGRLMLATGRHNEAIEWFERAKNIAEAAGISSLQLVTYEFMYEAYKEAGNPELSLLWLEKYNELNDSLSSAERDMLAAQYEAKFNLRKSQQENELILARQKQQESQLAVQKMIIGISIGGISFLLMAGILLVRTNLQRKQVNSELQDSNSRLNELNSTIRNKNNELAELNEIKTKLFAIIAHDLKGPLSSLQSLLYLLREHNLSEQELTEISDSLEMNLHENAAMMDNLLTWAKSQMSGISLNKKKIQFNICLKSVMDQLKYQADNKNVILAADMNDKTEMYADYDTIKLVLRNLLANAIKFSFKNSTIYVNIQNSDGMHQVSVQDSGIGIALENQQKIFAGENYTSRGTNNEHGSGLGLMLCKEFIERHGGTIWFESEKGKGTTFSFTIPEETADPDQDAVKLKSKSTIPEI